MLARELGVALDERAHAAGDHLLDLAAHREQLLAEVAQLRLERLVGVVAAHRLSRSAELAGDVVLGPAFARAW